MIGVPLIGAVVASPPGAAAPGQAAQGGAPATTPPPMTDILPIRPPVEISVGPPLWVWFVLGLIVLAALAALWYYRRRRQASPQAAGPPPVAPHVAAAALLRDLDAAAPRLSDREYYFELTGIMKGYIEDRFDQPAREMTVGELVPVLETLPPLPDDTVGRLSEFFRRAEPVKFAEMPAGPEQRKVDLAFVEGSVRVLEEGARRRETAELTAATAGVGGEGA